MKTPKITPVMLRLQPDQVCSILNRIIDELETTNKRIDSIEGDIVVMKKDIQELKDRPIPPEPEPGSDFSQVLAFNPNRMGSTTGMCLRNVMDGFGIAPHAGGSPNAYQDMLLNRNSGTLHAEIYPPYDISVPIYINTGTANQHVVAWHKGTVYSDGVVINDWVNYYGAENIYGWGELCDGIRVVKKKS